VHNISLPKPSVLAESITERVWWWDELMVKIFSMHRRMASEVKHLNGIKHDKSNISLVSTRKIWHQASPSTIIFFCWWFWKPILTTEMLVCFVILNADCNCRTAGFHVATCKYSYQWCTRNNCSDGFEAFCSTSSIIIKCTLSSNNDLFRQIWTPELPD
jgi:hypothetical protein